MSRPRPRSECPGVLKCPLYALSHSAEHGGLGCVDDMARPCRVERGERAFDALFEAACSRLKWRPLVDDSKDATHE